MIVRKESDTQYLILFIVILPLIGILAPPLGVAIMYGLVMLYIIQYNYRTLYFFICSTLVQNIVLIIGANRFGSTWTTMFSLSKEIMLYGCVVYSLIKNKKTPKYTMLWVLFLLALGASFILSDADTYSKFISVRQMLLPFICFYFGKGLKIHENELKNVAKIIINASIVVGIIGILELIVFKNSIWHMLPMQQYQINKGTTFSFYNGVPLNFYTWDYYAIVHSVVRRLVSIFGDPLITGHYLFLGYVLAGVYIEKRTKKRAIQVFLFICSILTLCKGIYVTYVVFFFMKLIKRYSYSTIKHMFLYIAGSAAVVAMLIYNVASRYLSTSSIMIHINGLINGIGAGGLFGKGLGKSGVLVQVLTQAESRLTGESYVGVLASQMGYIGLIVFFGFFILAIFRLIKRYKRNNNILIYNSAAIVLGVLVEAFFSESSIGIVGTGMYFILAGISISSHVDPTTLPIKTNHSTIHSLANNYLV